MPVFALVVVAASPVAITGGEPICLSAEHSSFWKATLRKDEEVTGSVPLAAGVCTSVAPPGHSDADGGISDTLAELSILLSRLVEGWYDATQHRVREEKHGVKQTLFYCNLTCNSVSMLCAVK